MTEFPAFKRTFGQRYGDTWQVIFYRHRDVIRIQKERFALPNLETIITTALEISNRTSFHSMSLRDLSRETKVSMGALYSYIESKERLLEMILEHVLYLVRTVLTQPPAAVEGPAGRLRWTLRAHVYLSEVMQPWFFFAYMEAKSFGPAGRKAAINSELLTESLIAGCIAEGQAAGDFADVDPTMTAAMIKPLLQDWYLKRWKYVRREIDPDTYADWVIRFVWAFLAPLERGARARPRKLVSPAEHGR